MLHVKYDYMTVFTLLELSKVYAAFNKNKTFSIDLINVLRITECFQTTNTCSPCLGYCHRTGVPRVFFTTFYIDFL
jgi:hypothetical protein